MSVYYCYFKRESSLNLASLLWQSLVTLGYLNVGDALSVTFPHPL